MNQWKSNIGFIISTIGAAVGLGQLWKFPYECGTNGGALFLLFFILFTFLIGVPLFLVESSIGEYTKKETITALKKLACKGLISSKWRFLGILGNITMIMILSFYAVISGWCLLYIYYSLVNTLDITMPVIDQLIAFYIFILINIFIVIKGSIRIEKVAKAGMALLLIILLGIIIYNFNNFKISKTINFLFTPDFNKLNIQTICSAMGQACFSLAVGAGCICVYSSYNNNSGKLIFNAHIVSIANILIAILAGLVIFPITFAYDISPQTGPKLIFHTLPNLFMHIKYGNILCMVLFSLFSITALTSSISLIEAPISGLIANSNLSRNKAIILLSGIVLFLGTLYICDRDAQIMSFVIKLSSDILIPLGGFLFSIFFIKIRNVIKIPNIFYNKIIIY